MRSSALFAAYMCLPRMKLIEGLAEPNETSFREYTLTLMEDHAVIL